MRVFLTGGTGFVGGALTRHLLDAGHSVTILTRPLEREDERLEGVSFVRGDPTTPGRWQEELPSHDAVVNLAGASIFRRWTRSAKQAMWESRIRTTTNLVDAMEACEKGSMALVSASAVGYYGNRGDDLLDEQSQRGDGFLADLAEEWEARASKAEGHGARVVRARFGVVLGEGGGALAKLIPMFKWWLGSPLGKGDQWFSWITLPDLVDAILFLLERQDVSGPVNCVAPNPVTNEEMTRTLGEALGKPTILPNTPRFMIDAVLGELGSIFLEGQRVVPKKLLESGFLFEYPDLRSALDAFIR